MSDIQALITEHLAIWTGADNEKRSGRGRASGSAASVYGVKKLRELILELAVRGKLVPQEASDEPASELLKRIEAEKAKLIKEGKIKAQKPFPEMGEKEKLFSLPSGWLWARFPDVYFFQEGPGIRNWQFRTDGVKLLNVQNIVDGNLVLENTDKHIDIEEYEQKYQHFTIEDGDLLFASSGGSWGKTAFFSNPPYKVIVNTSTIRLKPFFDSCSRLYLRYFIDCEVFKFQLRMQLVGMQPNFGSTHLNKVVFPLPPLAEQHRIVAKVDELMTLCDQLENQHSNAIVAHEKLVCYLLNTLTQSQDAAEFNESWHRIAANFDTLFSTESSIDALKQTLLQLAVMGKLVSQDVNDEPASELLKRIQAEKAKLIAEGKIKKDKPLAAIGDDEKPFELPKGWEWARLGSISRLQGGMAYQSGMFIDSGKNQVIRMGNVRPWRLRLDEKAVFIDDSLASVTMEYSLQVDDIVITMTGTIGKRDYVYSARIYESDLEQKKLYLNQRLCLVSPYLMAAAYLDLVLKDDRLLDLIFESATGTANQANIGMSSLNLWTLPLPPLAEQHHIVAKVDELMAICDQLKTHITTANQLQQKLADVLVAQAVA